MKVNIMESNLKKIISIYDDIETQKFTATRLMLLSFLRLHKDGLQFRELKARLSISDGKLYADLEKLKELAAKTKEKFKIDNKMLEIFMISPEGEKILEKTFEWVEYLRTLVK